MSLQKIGKIPTKVNRMEDALKVTAKDYNTLVDAFNAVIPVAKTATVDTINESTSGSGVTIEGVLLKDNSITGIKESISAAASTNLTAADSGKVFFIGDSAAVNYVLPTCEAGLRYKFIVIADETDATTITTSDTTDSTGEMLRGGLLVSAAAAVNTFIEASGNINKITLDDNVENGACGIGSWIEIIGTKAKTWFVTGVINSTTDADGVGSAIFSDVDA